VSGDGASCETISFLQATSSSELSLCLHELRHGLLELLVELLQRGVSPVVLRDRCALFAVGIAVPRARALKILALGFDVFTVAFIGRDSGFLRRLLPMLLARLVDLIGVLVIRFVGVILQPTSFSGSNGSSRSPLLAGVSRVRTSGSGSECSSSAIRWTASSVVKIRSRLMSFPQFARAMIGSGFDLRPSPPPSLIEAGFNRQLRAPCDHFALFTMGSSGSSEISGK
jgi:hypothetical protein